MVQRISHLAKEIAVAGRQKYSERPATACLSFGIDAFDSALKRYRSKTAG
jgi:hypothetical protein